MTDTPEAENDDDEKFFTVKDFKKILENLPDDMEVMAMVNFPPDDEEDGEPDGEEDEDKHLHYIPISGVEDITDEETSEKSLGLVVDVASYLDDEEEGEDGSEVDDGA